MNLSVIVPPDFFFFFFKICSEPPNNFVKCELPFPCGLISCMLIGYCVVKQVAIILWADRPTILWADRPLITHHDRQNGINTGVKKETNFFCTPLIYAS